MNLAEISSELRLFVCNKIVCSIPSHKARLWFYRKLMNFKLQPKVHIFMNCTFDCSENLSIGENSVINANCRLDNRGGLTIGENVSISEGVIILTADHDITSSAFAGRSREVTIEDYVWLGTRAMIMPGITIGKGAVVAAGAVVTRNVDPLCVVAGVPAKVIKMRDVNLLYQTVYMRLFQ